MSGFLAPLALVAPVLAGLALYAQLRNPDAHAVAAARGWAQLRAIAPRIPFALLAAECIGRLLPREHVAAWLGADAGLVGVVVGWAAGWFLPGGPMVAFPLAIALFRAGADQAPLVALLTAWSLMSINRTLLFEVPMMGTTFTLGRAIVSVPLPLLAGVLAAGIVTIL